MINLLETAMGLVMGHYGKRRATRSRVPLMNHIYEGRRIIRSHLNDTNAILTYNLPPEVVEAAFAIHPLIQDIGDLNENLSLILGEASDSININWLYALNLASQYRDLANAYLCRESTDHYTDEALTNLLEGAESEVLVMLLADKIQNRKDFKLYHHGSHERAEQLQEYFDRWVRVTTGLIYGEQA